MSESFNPNAAEAGVSRPIRFPNSAYPVIDANSYVSSLSDLANNPRPTTEIGKALHWYANEIAKGTMAPPSAYSYANAQVINDNSGSAGIIPWPGLDPSVLYKIVQENIAPQMIIGMRVDDVMRYSQHTSYPWRPGWRLELKEGFSSPTTQDSKDMTEARLFIENCGEVSDARERDALEIDDFHHFLTKIVRDSLTYDGIAVSTDFSYGGKIKSFRALPAGNIRLINRQIGFNGDKAVYAVMLDQVGSVSTYPSIGGNGNEPVTFKRDELVWYVRNSRTDVGVVDYGSPEIEQCLKLIQAFSNIMELLGDQFNKNAIPNGILLLKGPSWTQKQIDMVQRVMENLLKGITKRWSLPILATPDNQGIEMMPLNDLKDSDGRFNAFLNQSIGGICAIYRFPIRRFGYFASGESADNNPAPTDAAGVGLIDDEDPGLAPLLTHIETLVNEYLITPNFPKLRFAFTAKSPKENAREFQSRMDAMTFYEAREIVDLPSYAKVYEKALKAFGVESDDEDALKMKKILALVSLAPLNPNLSSSYNTLLANAMKTDDKEAKTEGGVMEGQKDPAVSEQRGNAVGGVRRDSAAEGAKSPKKGK